MNLLDLTEWLDDVPSCETPEDLPYGGGQKKKRRENLWAPQNKRSKNGSCVPVTSC